MGKRQIRDGLEISQEASIQQVMIEKRRLLKTRFGILKFGCSFCLCTNLYFVLLNLLLRKRTDITI